MSAGEFEPLSPVRGGVDELRKEFEEQSEYWDQRDEPAMSAMFAALHAESLDNPGLEKILEDTLVLRCTKKDDISASEVAGTWRVTLFDDQFNEEQYPDEFVTPEQWINPIREIVDLVNNELQPIDKANRAGRLTVNLLVNLVSTSPFTRANPDELLMQSLHQRMPEGVRWLDIASGMVTAPNHVLQKEFFPMSIDSMYALQPRKDGDVIWKPSSELKLAADELLAAPHRVSHCVATDIVDPYSNFEATNRAFSSLRGSERSDLEYMTTYFGLLSCDPSLSFRAVDFTDRKKVDELREELNGEKFDLVTISTVQHQLSTAQRRNMDANAISMLAPGGLLFKKDFAEYTPEEGLQFFKHWHDWGKYRGFVYDPQLPSLGLQEFCRSGDSRCKDLAISTGKIAIGDALYDSRDLVLRRGDVNSKNKVYIS